jgi:hypothetical protein
MQFKQWQLVAIIVGTFATIIAVDVFLQYQSNESFRANFPLSPGAMFAKSRAPEMIQQEMAPPGPPTIADEDA